MNEYQIRHVDTVEMVSRVIALDPDDAKARFWDGDASIIQRNTVFTKMETVRRILERDVQQWVVCVTNNGKINELHIKTNMADAVELYHEMQFIYSESDIECEISKNW